MQVQHGPIWPSPPLNVLLGVQAAHKVGLLPRPTGVCHCGSRRSGRPVATSTLQHNLCQGSAECSRAACKSHGLPMLIVADRIT